MPSSDVEQIETIVRLARTIDPKSILDIGVGFGKYGVLLREYLEIWPGAGEYGRWQRRIEGIEAFPHYLTPLHDYIYDRVHIGDALEVLPKIRSTFDLVLLIDVIEHFTSEEGQRLLTECDRVARHVLIASPFAFFDQDAVFGNPHEEHKSHWTRTALAGQSGLCLRVGASLIALRGMDVRRIGRSYRARLVLDRCKQRFPRTMRMGIQLAQAALGVVRR